ncbi:MAG: NAD(P)H-dependent oxidoreductase subunit E [Eubacteriales bacterium]
MKTLPVKICVCTECVMHGALDLVESIETLKNLAEDLDQNFSTDIAVKMESVKCLGEKHVGRSPRVEIGGVLYDNANSQTIMAEILSIISKDVKAE